MTTSKILIADDESNILMLLEIMLRDLNATIFSAKNGEEAITIALKEKPDLVISDVVMPKVNGFEVCRTIRNTKELFDTPIILLSALGDDYNKLTGFDEGADEYMIKPFNVEELKSRSKNLILKHQSKKNKSQNTTTSEKLCKTGIETLDNELFGGLPESSNILIVGNTGSGKSSFCRNFIKTGLENNESSLIISIDDDPQKTRHIIGNMLNTDIQQFESSNTLRFVDAYSWSSLTPPENEKFIITGSLELNQLSGIISDASFDIGQSIKEKKGGRRLIDSISSLLINFELSAVQRFLNQIARTGNAFGGVTTLFVLEEGTVNTTTLNNIKYIMDGVIELKKENEDRLCRVSSMKWSKCNNNWININPF